jgi:hypothetical protein
MCTRTCVTCHTSCVTAHVSLLMCTRTSVTCHLRRLMDEGSCAIALVSLHYVNLVGPCCTGMVCEAQVGTHPRPDAFPQKSLQTFATVVTITPPPPISCHRHAYQRNVSRVPSCWWALLQLTALVCSSLNQHRTHGWTCQVSFLLLTVVAVSRVALIHLNQPKAAGIDVKFLSPSPSTCAHL